MKCIVNGEEHEIPEHTSVEALIERVGLGDAVCAAEVDRRTVPKRERGKVMLREGQRVEIVTLIGGG